MKKLFSVSALLLLIIIVSAGCSKSGGGNGGGGTTEVALAVTTTPAQNSVNPPAPIAGSGLALNVNVTSAMPPSGVKITVSAAPTSGGTAFYTQNVSSTSSASTNFNVTGFPTGGVSCTCTVTVTSLSTSTNTWSGTFQFASK
jgi:hypothetical protein